MSRGPKRNHCSCRAAMVIEGLRTKILDFRMYVPREQTNCLASANPRSIPETRKEKETPSFCCRNGRPQCMTFVTQIKIMKSSIQRNTIEKRCHAWNFDTNRSRIRRFIVTTQCWHAAKYLMTRGENVAENGRKSTSCHHRITHFKFRQAVLWSALLQAYYCTNTADFFLSCESHMVKGLMGDPSHVCGQSLLYLKRQRRHCDKLNTR